MQKVRFEVEVDVQTHSNMTTIVSAIQYAIEEILMRVSIACTVTHDHH